MENYYLIGLKNGSWGIVSYLGETTLLDANKQILTLQTCRHHCDALLVADDDTLRALVPGDKTYAEIQVEWTT